ncbi:MAG: hypothetical protein AVO33_08650 [delta proteobacterium ML8_F1]|nr:MAG: hypothetical protein AVO33_08650 [delta proteobacterium ML8_F1]
MLGKWLILGLVGAAIGYLTNVIAIKLLFRPLEPTGLFKIQGLIPKRKAEIARSVGETVAMELVHVEEIMEDFIETMDKEAFKRQVGEKIARALTQKLIFVPESIVRQYVDQFIRDRGDDLINDIGEKVVSEAIHKVDISKIVEEKIMAFELEKMEAIVLGIAKRELRYIEIMGGILGLLIGLAQGFIILKM